MKRLLCRIIGHNWTKYVEVRRQACYGPLAGHDAVTRSRCCKRCGAVHDWGFVERSVLR